MERPVSVAARPDDLNYLRLVPKFDEQVPETFFVLFERLAETRGWSEETQLLMLQSVLTGNAQHVFSALSAAQVVRYLPVKSAVLKAYELVPEAYR